MSDKEMLELAAKAMQVTGHPHFANYTSDERAICLELGARPGAVTSYWKPLADVGAAMELAVWLGLQVTAYPIYAEPKHSSLVRKARLPAYADAPASIEALEPYGANPCAATCRAIVRVAAEIGRQHLAASLPCAQPAARSTHTPGIPASTTPS